MNKKVKSSINHNNDNICGFSNIKKCIKNINTIT